MEMLPSFVAVAGLGVYFYYYAKCDRVRKCISSGRRIRILMTCIAAICLVCIVGVMVASWFPRWPVSVAYALMTVLMAWDARRVFHLGQGEAGSGEIVAVGVESPRR